MEMKIQTFRGKEFKAIKGSTHPEYSFYTFEGEERDFREKYWDISEGDVVFDIGTSYGSYSLTACAMGATVYCFEPEKTVYADLLNNIMINGWRNRCHPSNSGMWSEEGSINMKSYAPHWPEATISGDYKMTTLDEAVSRSGVEKINWIKIDAEGAEENIIRGGLRAIDKFRPKMIIECHDFLDNKIREKVRALLPGYIFEEVVRTPCTMLLARYEQ